MRIPRMTTRRWMIRVAIVGMIMAGSRLVPRWMDFIEKARMSGMRVAMFEKARPPWIKQIERLEKAGTHDWLVKHSKKQLKDLEERSALHKKRRHGYLRAAYRPWESISPDLP